MIRDLWQSIPAGSLRHLVEIQAQTTAADDFNQRQEVWAPVRTCNASISTASPAERATFEQVTSEASHMIIVRWTTTAIQAGMRIVFGAHIFKVQAVDNVRMRNKYVRMLCLELNAAS